MNSICDWFRKMLTEMFVMHSGQEAISTEINTWQCG